MPPQLPSRGLSRDELVPNQPAEVQCQAAHQEPCAVTTAQDYGAGEDQRQASEPGERRDPGRQPGGNGASGRHQRD